MGDTMSKVSSYPKGDLRRMLAVIAAVDCTPDATLAKVVAKTALDKKTVSNLIAKAAVQAEVLIVKTGPFYVLHSWGPIINRDGAQLALAGSVK